MSRQTFRLSFLLLLLLSCGMVQPMSPHHQVKNKTRRLLLRRLKRAILPRALEWVAVSEGILLASRRLVQPVTTTIVTSNLAVFALWQAAQLHADLQSWMGKHFLLSHQSFIRRNYPHTWLSSSFSHATADHLASNMSALRLFAPRLIATHGKRWFVYFYIGAIYFSGLFDVYMYEKIHCYALEKTTELLRILVPSICQQLSHQSLRSPSKPISSLGASGAVMFVMVKALLENPNMRIQNPIPGYQNSSVGGLQAALALVAVDAMRITSTDEKAVGHGAHIGGAVFAMILHKADYLGALWSKIVQTKVTERQSRRR